MLFLVTVRFVTTVGLLLQSTLGAFRFAERRDLALRASMFQSHDWTSDDDDHEWLGEEDADSWERELIEDNWELLNVLMDSESWAIENVDAFLLSRGTETSAMSKNPSFKSRIGMHYLAVHDL